MSTDTKAPESVLERTFNTLEDVFTFVVRHLLKQNKSAMGVVNGVETCVYRGEDGTKCAAGVLIKDEYYSPELEGCSVFDNDVQVAICNSYPELKSLEGVLHVVAWLQRVHDKYGDTGGFHCYSVRSDFGLIIEDYRLGVDINALYKEALYKETLDEQ